jgi:hypothetical protein
MLITVEDRRAVSADATVEMVEAYARRTGWTLEREISEDDAWARTFRRGDAVMHLMSGYRPSNIRRIVDGLAEVERRQPSEVLSDIVGYQVGLDRGRASVLRNSASARVVEAREAMAKVRPSDATGRERVRVRLAQAEAELVAATRALEAAKAAEERT